MRLKSLTVMAAVSLSMTLSGCAAAPAQQHAGMMKAGGKNCAMHAKDGGEHSRGQAMAGCQMMNHAKEKPAAEDARTPEERDPHAEHRPK